MNLLSIRDLNQSYGGSHTLWDVALDVPAGSRTCLMGRNGMGKTTLLKCIMGLLPVSSGSITFEDTDLRRLPAESRARLGIGYVPQGPRDLSATHGRRKPADWPRRAAGRAASRFRRRSSSCSRSCNRC